MSLYDHALTVLTGWHPPDEQQHSLRSTYVRHLATHADGLLRTCHPDHITASTLVVSPDRVRVLLNLHRRYGIWVQFGGHCERADTTLAAAALREASEESGIAELRLLGEEPVQLSTHEVRCGPLRPSHHLDVRFAAVAPDDGIASPTEESLDVRWFDVEALPPGLDEPLAQLIEWSRGL